MPSFVNPCCNTNMYSVFTEGFFFVSLVAALTGVYENCFYRQQANIAIYTCKRKPAVQAYQHLELQSKLIELHAHNCMRSKSAEYYIVKTMQAAVVHWCLLDLN